MKILTNYIKIVNDLDTPVSIYHKISAKFEDSFLFESVVQGHQLGRYSFIGFNALKTISSSRMLTELKKEIDSIEYDDDGLPFLAKGFVGFFPFETFQEIEPSVKAQKEEKAFFYLIGNLIVFDHVQQKLYLIENKYSTDTASNLEEIKELISNPNQLQRLDFDIDSHINEDFESTGFYSNTGKEDFKLLVEKAKKHIFEGDVFQMVLSHKFIKDFADKSPDPLLLYRILRSVNPSPYQFLFNFKENGQKKTLVGSSPETMVKSFKEIEDGTEVIKAQIFPIAGTYRKTNDVKKDLELKKALLADEKELAEHVMLIDLARNDLAKVCYDVHVPEKIYVEEYSHVMHIVSKVTATLKNMSNSDSVIELFKAAFPAGTLSGAPKIEAIKRIMELEKDSRGYYGGSIGYLALNSTLDTAIMIRTMLVEEKSICIQAGCGVVADSDWLKEWQETFNKANALIDVVLVAEDLTKK